MTTLKIKNGERSGFTRVSLLLMGIALSMLISVVASAANDKTRVAFKMTSLDKVIKQITGDSKVNPSSKIKITVPPIAELGREVGVRVKATGLKNVESITLLAENNTNPMLASFNISTGTDPFIKSRVKLRKSTKVVALVKAGGKYYIASEKVKITIGGCGGG